MSSHLRIAKEFKYQSFDMCLALWPAHYRYFRVFSFTASCFKFAKKVLPQLKFKLHTKTRSTSFFIIGSPSISYYNHCVLWLSSFCQEYVCWKKHRVWICRCTSCDLLSWGSNHQPLDNQSAALTTPPIASNFFIGTPSISYCNHCVSWLSSFCQEYVCRKKNRVWTCRCTSCDVLVMSSKIHYLRVRSAFNRR